MKKLTLLGIVALSASSAVSAGEIAQMYQKAVGPKTTEKPMPSAPQANPSKKSGITEIGLERTPCFGMCPVYTVILKSDGTVRYNGEAHVQTLGKRTGKIQPWQFERLAGFIKDSGYMNLKNNYAAGHTDAPTAFTTVSMGSKRKVVRDYGNAGPSSLWAVEQLIDKVVAETEWTAVPSGGSQKPMQ